MIRLALAYLRDRPLMTALNILLLALAVYGLVDWQRSATRRELAVAARGYSPANPPSPVTEQGPADVRAVIAAFNADKPLDRFIVEQIAGDLLPHESVTYFGDTARRVVPIDLDAGCENPEEREGFAHDPLVLDGVGLHQRGELLLGQHQRIDEGRLQPPLGLGLGPGLLLLERGLGAVEDLLQLVEVDAGDAAQVLRDVGATTLDGVVKFTHHAVDQGLCCFAGVDVHGVDLVDLVLQFG